MLLETFTDKFEYQKLTEEEKAERGILGRLVGVIADTKNPTRNGRAYSEKLWRNVFNDPIMKERIENRCCFGELGHPLDRTETDMEKVAICLAEVPKKGKDGKLYGVFDILNTKCGQILKTLCDYGCNIGISSRGEGDLITDYQGNEAVDPDTYSCECWDAVLIPAVKEARLQYVTESLGTKKSLQESLKETLDAASEVDRKVMKEALDSLNIKLNEADEYRIVIALKNENTGAIKRGFDVRDRAKAFQYMLNHPFEDFSLYYERYLNGKFLDAKLLAKSATDSEIDSYYRQNVNKVQIYIDGDFIPKRTPAADIKQAKADGKSVLINYGSKIKESLSEDIDSGRMDDYQWLINVEGLTPEEAWEQITTYDYADDEEPIENVATEEKSLDIDNLEEAKVTAVDNNEALVEALQEALKVRAKLEQKVMTLQEKLSVCYAKETKIEEEAEKYKTSVRQLAESSKEAKALQARVSLLEEKLNDTKKANNNLKEQLNKMKVKVEKDASKTSSLRESISTKTNEVFKLNEKISTLNESLEAANKKYDEVNKKLTESIEKRKTLAADYAKAKELVDTAEKEKAALTESVAQLKKDISLQKSNTDQKLAKSKQLIEKYKKATNIAVDKYIESQAVRLGSSVEEIKNRLPESYSFNDIDKICEDLQNYNLNMSKLPFNTLAKKVNINEGLKVTGVSSKNESILPVSRFDDDIDADLMYLAGQ